MPKQLNRKSKINKNNLRKNVVVVDIINFIYTCTFVLHLIVININANCRT